MNYDRRILGEKCIYSSDCLQTGLNNNTIICGTSGSGKTKSILEPCLLENENTNLIISVSKRHLIDVYKPLFEKRGYKVLDVNFTNPSESDALFDPLRYIQSYQDISALCDQILVSNAGSTADPYWHEAAKSLLGALIACAMMTRESASMVDVISLLNSLDFRESLGQIVTSLDDTFEMIKQKDPASFAINCWKSFRRLPIRTAGCVFGYLNSSLDNLFTPDILTGMQKGKNLDFMEFATEKTVVFVTTSPVNVSLNRFINLFYSQAIKSLFEIGESFPEGKLPIPVHLFFDDFAVGCPIEMFPRAISIFREKGLSVSILIQSETQLEGLYGVPDSITIINNADSYVYLGGCDIRTAEVISRRANLPLEDILSLPVGQEIVFRRGNKPQKTSRYDIFNDERYKRLIEEYNERKECQEEAEVEK